MKKLIALLMALLMVATMMTTAMAYDVVTPTNNTPALSHTMKLTEDELTHLPYATTYSFKVVSGPNIVQPTEVNDPSQFVTGSPNIADLVYTPTDVFVGGNCTKPLAIDWDGNEEQAGVSIKEPGLYYWKIEKTMTSDAPEGDKPSNYNGEIYLYILATVDGSGSSTSLKLTAGLAEDQNFTKKINTNNPLNDQYPSQYLSLSVKKVVTGTQGSHNEYFPIVVTLTPPVSTIDMTYSISGIEQTVNPTAYDSQSHDNPLSVTVPAGEVKAEFTLWMKHGQTAVIDGLLYNTGYIVMEEPIHGYEASAAVTSGAPENGDINASVSKDTDTGIVEVNDPKLTANSTIVTVTNHKDATVPTGIDLQTGAPIFGLLMAMAMMFMVFAGKRKEQML